MITTLRNRIERLVVQIQADFLDHPRLALTLPAAERRFGVDEVTCASVLGALVEARVLAHREGAYVCEALSATRHTTSRLTRASSRGELAATIRALAGNRGRDRQSSQEHVDVGTSIGFTRTACPRRR